MYPYKNLMDTKASEVTFMRKLVAVTVLALLFLLFSLLYANYYQTVQYTKLLQLEKKLDEFNNIN